MRVCKFSVGLNAAPQVCLRRTYYMSAWSTPPPPPSPGPPALRTHCDGRTKKNILQNGIRNFVRMTNDRSVAAENTRLNFVSGVWSDQSEGVGANLFSLSSTSTSSTSPSSTSPQSSSSEFEFPMRRYKLSISEPDSKEFFFRANICKDYRRTFFFLCIEA